MGGGRRRLPRAEGRCRSKPSLRDHVVDCTCVTLGGWGGDGRPRHAAATGLDVRRLRARRLIVARLSRCRKVMYRFSCGCRCGIGSWPERGRGGHRLRSRCRRWRMASSDSCFCLRHLPLGPSVFADLDKRGGAAGRCAAMCAGSCATRRCAWCSRTSSSRMPRTRSPSPSSRAIPQRLRAANSAASAGDQLGAVILERSFFVHT